MGKRVETEDMDKQKKKNMSTHTQIKERETGII